MKASQRITFAALVVLIATLFLAITPPGARAADLTVQTIDEAGITPTFAAASAGGDKFTNGAEDVFCEVKNAGGSGITVTIPANANARTATGLGGVTKADAGGSVAATTGDKMFGPFPKLAFNGSDGKVSINYSAVTSVTVGCFKVPRTR